MEADPPLLRLSGYGLTRSAGPAVLADVGFSLHRGEILGVVGESGSGKSQLLLSLLGLAMPDARTSGSACFGGRELVGATPDEWRQLRGRRIAMLFQDPLLSWNPYLRVGVQLGEVLERDAVPRAARDAKVDDALRAVGLQEPRALRARYPHELSGGMRQRAMLAMALLGGPELLLADEPTTALDAVSQRAVLDLLAAQAKQGLAVLIVTHDLGVVARIADRMLVLRAGRIVEEGETAALLRAPRSDYARELVAAARRMESAGSAA